jgi:hypothetical protein
MNHQRCPVGSAGHGNACAMASPDHAHTGGGREIWEFPDLIEREKGADRLGVRDADKTKKKRRREAREISLLRRPQQI